MNRRLLVVLLLCSTTGWIIGNGLFALLPVYAVRLGADSASIGNYLSLAFAALTVGTISAGWLSNRFGRQKLFFISTTLVCVVCTGLIAAANQFWQLVVLTSGVWLFGGIGGTLIAIVAGLRVTDVDRGKVFGLLGSTGAVGGLVGGALSGAIVDRWGYPALFVSGALGYAVQLAAGLLLPDTTQPFTADKPKTDTKQADSSKAALGTTFYLLMLAGIIASLPAWIVSLGRPLLMDKVGFDAAAISGAVAVGGAVALPFPLILSWLSGRVGQYRMLAFCYVMMLCGVGLLLVSTALWHFWLTAIFIAIGSVGGTVGLVLIGKVVPPEALSNGIARYNANGWIGAIIGLSGTGYALKLLGANLTFALGVVLALVAIGLLLVVRAMSSKRPAVSLNQLEQTLLPGSLATAEIPAPFDMVGDEAP